MTREEFEKWKANWYNTVPRCDDFACCHELTSCGVDYLCGDCTIYEVWQQYRDILSDKITCTDAQCIDCISEYSCNKHQNMWRKS